ncbi:MAG: hypothetical protein K8R90_06940 [Candidatus Cloacimonetes bacterium]|nr:hypothetical protein [Candidatus Cloacimonadota bacterium]
MGKKGMLLFVLIIIVGALSAQEMMGKLADQIFAPEQLIIRVISADDNGCETGTRCDIEVRAEVIEVRKTQTNLEVGDRITIKYDRYNPPDGWTGSTPITLVERGQEYQAYLATYRYSFYVPIAGNASFTSYTETLDLELAEVQRGVERIRERIAKIEAVLE